MKQTSFAQISLLSALAAWATATSALAQGTAFTFQGFLRDANNPGSGVYDLRLTLYDSANISANVVAGPITNSGVSISNGLFTTRVDFGSNPFTGAARWLEIAARTNSGGEFVTLSPRQPIAPAPYVLKAHTVAAAAAANSVAAAALSGQVTPGAVPSAAVTNNASGITLNGRFSGQWSSPAFQVANVTFTNSAPNGFEMFSGSFVSHGGTLIIQVSASGYAQTQPGLIGVNLFLDTTDATPLDTIAITANHTFSHLAFVAKQTVVAHLPAGTHTLLLPILNANTLIDPNDVVAATIQELPF